MVCGWHPPVSLLSQGEARGESGGSVASYRIGDVELEIPDAVLSAALREALERGHYEHAEARAIGLHLMRGDRVLELGAGAGFLSVQIARRVGPGALLAVEAHPGMADVARANLARNGMAGAGVLGGAVVPDDHAGATIGFHLAEGFWSSSLSPPDPLAGDHGTPVPAWRIGDLLARHRPDVVVIDIEGGEELLFDAPWPDPPRLIVMEIHPQRYPGSTVRRIFDWVSAAGLAYCATGSRGTVVVFERVRE